MIVKTKLPCPFCKRPLNLDGLQSGQIGCKGCRNISYYDGKRLTPVLKFSPPKIQARAKIPLKYIIYALVTAAICLLLLGVWLLLPARIQILAPDEPAAILEDVQRHLKSLAE